MSIFRHRAILSAIFALFCCAGMNAESSDSAALRLSRFVDNIAAFNHLLPQEKVYLHFDNTSYFIGETIWFKAYVVTAPEHRATDMSRILHVELITREGTIVDRRKLKIENGQCWGEFELKKEYQSGYYEVRAYTREMLNFGMIQQPYEKEINAFFFDESYTERFFQESGTAFSRVFPVYCEPREPGLYREKTIRVRPKVTGKNEPKNPPEKRPEIVFYPEGGHLVKGLMSRVAFEARNEEGRWVEVKGTVEGQKKGPDGRSAGTFRTSHRGKGDFYCLPQAGGRSKVSVEYQGKTYHYELPEPLDEGYVMTVNRDRKGDFLVEVQRSAGQEDELLGLSVICRGTPYVFESFALEPDAAQTSATAPCSRIIRIGSELLPTGVNQITLFNAEGRIFAERLVFVDHGESDNYQLKVFGAKDIYEPFEKVELSFRVLDDKSLVDTANFLQNNSFSLSITDESSREENYSLQNIRNNLLLSSDLYGFIENPEYYFNKTDKHLDFDLDLLMLVQGWRRYDWQQMAGIRPFDPEFPIEKGLRVSGKIYPMTGTRRSKEKRLGDGMEIEAYLIKDTLQMMGVGQTLKEGDFSFDFPDFTGEGWLFVKVNEDKGIAGKSLSDFFDIRETGGHWPFQYIPLNVYYSPHVRALSHYETSPIVRASTWKQKSSDREQLAEKSQDEAWNLTLQDVEISAKRHLTSLDYSLPAIVLDPMQELDLQMDMGMFFGVIDRGLIGINAAVRHGLRGDYIFTFNQRQGPIVYALSKTAALDDSGILADATVALEYGWRVDDADLYLRRYLRGRTDEPDIANSIIQDSVKFIRNPYLERVSKISLFADNIDRDVFSMKDVRDSYTADFIVNFQFFTEPEQLTPIFRGRRVRFEGYSLAKQFYSPNYASYSFGSQAPKDHRRTLYWNPDVRTDSKGTARILFYNSRAGHLKISAEGLAQDGTALVYEN